MVRNEMVLPESTLDILHFNPCIYYCTGGGLSLTADMYVVMPNNIPCVLSISVTAVYHHSRFIIFAPPPILLPSDAVPVAACKTL